MNEYNSLPLPAQGPEGFRPPSVPDGVPSLLRLGQVAAVLDLHEETLRGWARRGKLRYVQASSRSWRLFPAEEVSRLAAALGLSPDWLRAIE